MTHNESEQVGAGQPVHHCPCSSFCKSYEKEHNAIDPKGGEL